MELKKLLHRTYELGGSDIFILPGARVTCKVKGDMVALSEEIEKQSMKVSEFASLYMKLKNREDLTGAAKERYNGAMDLWAESEMIRVDYRKLPESDSLTKDPVTGEYRETSFNDMVKEHESPGKESVREPRVRRRAPAPEDEMAPEELRREKSLEAPTLTNGPGY